MVEGKIEIYLSYKEPEYRDNLMWLRPYLDREGFELLYYGANGWTRFIPCHPIVPPPIDEPATKPDEPIEDAVESNEPMTSIGSNPIGDTEGSVFETNSAMLAPGRKPSCGCPN